MPQGDKFYTILARTDLMESVGVESFSTLEEFESLMEQISAANPDVTMLAGAMDRALIRWFSPDTHNPHPELRLRDRERRGNPGVQPL